jgi:signal transduction histidine kinase/integral membrane sensor domain MASE1/ActR/RegA family two-component response regulator
VTPSRAPLITLLWRAALVWAAYSLCGAVAVACGVPGQQVAPLYVSAGLALAFVQGWGLWMLLPVALGGFTVDAATLAVMHPSSLGTLPWLAAASACGLGAALQAWVAWRWVSGGRPDGFRLDTTREIARFLLLGGLLACTLSAGLSVPALVATGWIPREEGLNAFVSWWAGDAMGVALATPLGLTLVGHPAAAWRTRRLAVGVPLALSVVLLSLGSRAVGQARLAHETELFQRDAQTTLNAVKLRLQGYLDGLQAHHSLFAVGAEVSRISFDRASAPWLQRLQGVRGFAWDERVARADAAEFERRQRADGAAGFRIRPTPGAQPSTGDEQVVLRLVTPPDTEPMLMGMDILSLPATRAAFEQARREDRMVASAPFTLAGPASVKGLHRGMVIYLPVYHGQPYTPQARVQANRGVISLSLWLEEASAAMLSERPAYMGACLIDRSEAQADWLGGTRDCVNASQRSAHVRTELLDVAGRSWELRLWNQTPVPALSTGLNSWVFTLVGVAFCGAWGALLLVLTSHARHLQAARDEAQARRLEAERANRAKSEFMSRMSHELRTPLNAVLGFAQVMEMDRKDPLSASQRDRLSQVQQAGWNLLEMIDDVLDIARLDTGALRLQNQLIPVGQELMTAHRLFEADAHKAKVTLHSPASWPAGWRVMADAARLRQILGHLLSNAIKFNEPGGEVWLEAREDRLGPHLMLRISVRDTGMGLNAEQLAQLFQPFSRVGREHGPTVGRGVGLAISRHLAQLMGGELQAEGMTGQGATFTLSLPLHQDGDTTAASASASGSGQDAAATPNERRAAPAEGTPRRRHVLYVEDNPTNSEVLRAALANRADLQLTVAEDTETGLAVLHDRLRGQQPQLILLDVHLPDASGLEFLKLAKANPDTSGIPVIMVSADALPEQIDAALTAGAACYLTKPVQLPALLAQMDELLGAG